MPRALRSAHLPTLRKATRTSADPSPSVHLRVCALPLSQRSPSTLAVAAARGGTSISQLNLTDSEFLSLSEALKEIRGTEQATSQNDDDLRRKVQETRREIASAKRELSERARREKRDTQKVVITVGELRHRIAKARESGYNEGCRTGFASVTKHKAKVFTAQSGGNEDLFEYPATNKGDDRNDFLFGKDATTTAVLTDEDRVLCHDGLKLLNIA